MARTIAIIGALEKEVSQIYDALSEHSVVEEAGLAVARGVLGGARVVACTAGMGTVNAAAATQHLLSRYEASTVIFSGIAGGLNPALHINDVVIGERLRYLDTDTALVAESTPGLEEFASSPELVDVAEAVLLEQEFIDAAACPAAPGDDAPRFMRGTIATGDRFITGALRDAVVEQTGADCAEMEGAAVAHIAAKNGARCLVLRAISDNCDESYDALCERSFELEDYARTASSIVLEIIRRIA